MARLGSRRDSTTRNLRSWVTRGSRLPRVSGSQPIHSSRSLRRRAAPEDRPGKKYVAMQNLTHLLTIRFLPASPTGRTKENAPFAPKSPLDLNVVSRRYEVYGAIPTAELSLCDTSLCDTVLVNPVVRPSLALAGFGYPLASEYEAFEKQFSASKISPRHAAQP